MIHESGSKAYAGTVELTSIADEFLNEMYGGNLSIGSKIGFCEVFVGDNEGQIPHFHIKSKSVKWECCLELYRNRYFSHGSKIWKLNSKQCKILDNWLRQKSTINPFKDLTNWEVLCGFWLAQNNPKTNVPSNPKMPDYSIIY